MKLIHTGVQWYCLPIENDFNGKPELSFTRIYRIFRRWIKDGSLRKVFESSVVILAENNLLDTTILHSDGTTTAAKKGGDVIGYSGHKHQREEKIVAITDRNANIIAPFIVAAANKNECNLFPRALQGLKKIAKLVGINLPGTVMSLDSAYDSRENGKMIFNELTIYLQNIFE